MLHIVSAMLAVIASWCFLAVIFIGVGWLLARAVHLWSSRPESLFLFFWLGWGAVILFLQLWHLKFKIDEHAFAIVAIAGLIGWIFNFQRLRTTLDALRSTSRRSTWRVILAVSLTVCFWASIAIGPLLNADTGLYHMHGVRWNSAYPIVAGLGNLHARLAFNNSSYLYAAMLDSGPWTKKGHHLANGLVSLAVLLQMVVAVPGAIRTGHRRWIVYMLLVLLMPAAALFCYKNTTSFQADLSTFLIGIVLTIQLLALFVEERHKISERHFLVFAICFLSAVGVSVKLSFAPFGLTAALIALGCLHVKPHVSDTPWRRYRVALVALLFGSAVLIPWMIRGVILSGYIAFPSTAIGFDVPWRVPHDLATFERDWIYSWARNPNAFRADVLGNWDWIGGWLLCQLRDFLKVVLPFACAAVGLVTALRNRRSPHRCRDDSPWLWLVLLPAVLTILFVLNTAPNFAFAGASLWILGAGSMVLALQQFDHSSQTFHRRLRLIWTFTIILLFVVFVKAARYTNWRPSNGSGFQPIPVVEVVEKQTASGLSVYVPKTGARSWDSPLPSTPYCQPRLALRRKGDLSSGFVMRAKKLVSRRPVDKADTAELPNILSDTDQIKSR